MILGSLSCLKEAILPASNETKKVGLMLMYSHSTAFWCNCFHENPNFVVLAAIPAIRRILKHLKETGDVKNLANEIVSFKEFFDLMGMDDVKALEERYVTDETRRADY